MVSIIVPAYNVAEYLHECVDSILSQTYRDIEVILVDDGSHKDSTPQICDEYAVRDARVKVVHKENGGLPRARQSGIKISSGEYIYCVDADDSIEPDTIETLVALMDDDISIVAAEEDIDAVMTAGEWGNWFLHWNAIHVWGKLYRHDVIDDDWVFDFDRSITVAEDFVTNLRCLRNIKGRVKVSSVRKYHYRQLHVSMVHAFKRTPEYDLKILQEARKIMSQTDIDVKEGFVVYQIGMLEHLINWNYPADKSWVDELRGQAGKFNLNLYQKMVLGATDNKMMALAVRVITPFVKAKKRVERYFKWRND